MDGCVGHLDQSSLLCIVILHTQKIIYTDLFI